MTNKEIIQISKSKPKKISILCTFKEALSVYHPPCCLVKRTTPMDIGPSSVADPGSSAFLTPGSLILDGYKIRFGSGMNIPDHISESLEATFLCGRGSEIFLTLDPESGMEKIRIQGPE